MSPKISGEVKRLGPEMGGKMVERKKSLGIKPDRSAHIEARKKMVERRANKLKAAENLQRKLTTSLKEKNRYQTVHKVEGGKDAARGRLGGPTAGKRTKEQAN